MTKFIRFLVCAIFLMNLPYISFAEEVLTWRDCVVEARDNNPELKSAQELIKRARAERASTTGGLLPQIDSSMSGRTSKSVGESQSDSYSYSVGASQLIFDGFKTLYNRRADSLGIDTAEYGYEIASSEVRLGLRNAFIELLRAQESLKLREEILTRRKQNLELVQLRYKAGREHKGSLLTSEASLIQAEFEVAQANRDITIAQRRLSKELGRVKYVPIRIEESLSSFFGIEQKQPDFELLLDKHPSSILLDIETEIARYGVKSSGSDFLPNVRASGSIGKSGSDWPPDKEGWSAGVSLSLPIFEGTRRIAAVSRAKSTYRKAIEDRRKRRDDLLLGLEESWNNFQDSIERVRVREKFLDAAKARAEIARVQYSTGLLSFDNWAIIEDSLVSTKQNYLAAQADALTREANWIKAKGGTLDVTE